MKELKRFWNCGNLIGFLFASLLVSSCTNNQDSIVPGNGNLNTTGKLHLLMTDDPMLLQHVSDVNVTIEKISLRKMDSTEMDENESLDGENEDSTAMGEHDDMDTDKVSSYITVLETPQDINLMDLRNGVTIDLADTSIHAGTYDMIRLYISKASIVFDNGASFDLKIPGAAESGLKIFIPSGIVVSSENTTELLLDFNLERSLVALGPRENPIGYHLCPVIRAIDNANSGKLEGHVMDTSMMALTGAYVWLKGDSVISSTTSEPSGFYRMIGIPEGTYTLFAAKEGYDTAKIESLHVWGSRETKEDIKLVPSSD